MEYQIKIHGVTKQKSGKSKKMRHCQNEKVRVVAPENLDKKGLEPYVRQQVGYVDGFTILTKSIS